MRFVRPGHTGLAEEGRRRNACEVFKMSYSVRNPAVDAFHEIEVRRGRRDPVPPVARLGAVVMFLVVLSSFGKYDLASVLSFAVYPISLACFEHVGFSAGIFRFWPFLIPVFLLGIANPFFDRAVIAYVAGFPVSGGWISFAVLMSKGVLSFCVTWSLLRKTGVDGIVNAFAALRLPSSFGMAVLLMHRYLVLLIKESERMKDAYLLRSGGRSRSLRPSSWGPFVGLLLIRSLDRAANVQSAIELRGGYGRMRTAAECRDFRRVLIGFLYFAGWGLCFASIRLFNPLCRLVGLIREAFI